MNSYYTCSVSLSLFLFLVFPCVLCQLSPTQNSTMISLSNIIRNNSVVGSSWNVAKNPNPCLWKGVSCRPNNSAVIRISLSGFGLSDPEILSVVCKIESLQGLDVSRNLFGSIPGEFISGCGVINGLRALNFSRNGLVGSLPTFSGFTGLETLDLSYNFMSGVIGLEIDSLVSLKSLNLSSNEFNGSVPTNLGKSLLLEELQLAINGFVDVIPQELLRYQKLRVLDLSANSISGSIPDGIANLSSLRFLILSANKLSGPIPESISNITTLFRFAANQNNFQGSVPSGITRYLGNLDLSYNKLTGPVPSLSPSNLVSLDLSFNLLEGSIPDDISTSLFRLRLGSNSLNGSIPKSLGSLEKLLYVELDNNSLSGVIPIELGSCKNLALLNLAQNKLLGSLPDQLGNLSNLQVLKLQLNKLNGEIPTSITGLKKLSILNISSNSLTGTIPPSISKLTSLAHLTLQGNNLNGSIPDTMYNMNALLELQLGDNKLSGRIPQLPLKLQIGLNLSSNLYQGKIPTSLSTLKDLEVLDLSNNKFSGEIPDFMTLMGSLTQLVLSNNNLSGVIPTFRPYVSLSLCGNTGLINATKPESPVVRSTKRTKSVALAVIVAIAAALLSGVVVTVVVLSSSRRFSKINDQQSLSGEDLPLPLVIQGNLLTGNGIHRSNINFTFTKAMEAVADPLNISLKTRFSTYYQITVPSGASYFIKKINWSDKIHQLGSHNKFKQELEVLGKLSNSNVMTPLAYVLTTDSAYLFYEYAQKGTLFDVLHGNSVCILDWASRYSIAVGVAQGLAFLHGCSSGPILLLDFSSRNIFLKSLKEPLVGDIELCKVIDPSKSIGSLSTVAGSVGYIPPEYAYTMRVTMAGNVYSFGVVLLELLTGKPAVSEGMELAKWVLSNSSHQERLGRVLDFNICKTSVAVKNQMLELLKVALSCVSIAPEARPKMKTVLRLILNAR